MSELFCKPLSLTYIASRTQRKRIHELPLIEKAERKRHCLDKTVLKKEALNSFILILFPYTLPDSLDFLIQYLKGHLNSELVDVRLLARNIDN